MFTAALELCSRYWLSLDSCRERKRAQNDVSAPFQKGANDGFLTFIESYFLFPKVRLNWSVLRWKYNGLMQSIDYVKRVPTKRVYRSISIITMEMESRFVTLLLSRVLLKWSETYLNLLPRHLELPFSLAIRCSWRACLLPQKQFSMFYYYSL